MPENNIFMLYFSAAVVFGLVCYLIYDSISQALRKKKVKTLDSHFEKVLNRNLDDDIKTQIISTITSGFTIKNPTYSVVNVVRSARTLKVIVEVKAYDYEMKKNVTGYFSLEYFYVPELEEFHICSKQSRSMSMETKLAANIPYGGWFKDDRQIRDEKDYWSFNGKRPASRSLLY